MTSDLKVQFDGKTYPVTITDGGFFIVDLGHADLRVVKETFAQLIAAVDGLEKRRAEKAKKKVTPIEVGVVDEGGVRNIHILGTTENNNIRTRGLEKGEKLAKWQSVYKPFTAEDSEEIAKLYRARQDAIIAYNKFLKSRELGDAQKIAYQVDKSAG